jgi:histone H2A
VKKHKITPRHLKLAIFNDNELVELVGDAMFPQGGAKPHVHPALLLTREQQKKRAGGKGAETKRGKNLKSSKI